VIVPPAEFARVSDKLIALREQDAMLEQRVRSGATEPPDFEQLLERVGVRWLAPVTPPKTRSSE